MTGLMWRDHGDDMGAVLGPDGHELATYSWSRQANHPYFHPVRPLGHRGVLTNHAPWDHRWHHGLWWSWKFLNGYLFWEDHPDYGGEHRGLGRSVVGAHEVEPVGVGVRISERLSWQLDGSGQELLSEERTIVAGPSSLDGAWSLDWDLTWTATTDVRMSTTPRAQVAWGGYAGLNYRPARSLGSRECLLASTGEGELGTVDARTVSWAAYLGSVDGAGNDEPKVPAQGGLAILQHPDNVRFPAPAYAASAENGFGFLAAAPLLDEDLDLPAQGRLRLRYRTLVLGRQVTAEELERAHAEYTTGSPLAR